jgi:hypothetical protein
VNGAQDGGAAEAGSIDWSSVGMLLKPYRDHELARALRHALDHAAPPAVGARAV